MIQVICCSSLLSVPGRAGAFSRDFTTSLAPECRAFSGALKIEKLKAPLIPGPEGAVDTNDWCITCKYEEDPIKNEGARVLTRLYDVFSDAQGQLTPKSVAEFCPNSNSSKLL